VSRQASRAGRRPRPVRADRPGAGRLADPRAVSVQGGEHGRTCTAGGSPPDGCDELAEVARQDALEQPAVAIALRRQQTRGRVGQPSERRPGGALGPAQVGVVARGSIELDVRAHDHPLVVGVELPARRPAGLRVDAIPDDAGLPVHQRVVQPVDDPAGPPEVVGGTGVLVQAGGEHRCRTVRRRVRVGVAAPEDDPAVPTVPAAANLRPEPPHQRAGVYRADLVGPEQRQPHPCHVVVVIVQDVPTVALHDASDEVGDAPPDVGGLRSYGGVDAGVQRVGLPPVVPPRAGKAAAGRHPKQSAPPVPVPIDEHALCLLGATGPGGDHSHRHGRDGRHES
jgi:hypothetical protein